MVTRRLLDEDGVRAAAEQADVRREIDGVAQAIRAGQDLDGAAAEPGDVIDGGLDHSVGRADEVGVLRADGDGEPLLPVRLAGAVAGGGPRASDGGRSAAGTRAASSPAAAASEPWSKLRRDKERVRLDTAGSPLVGSGDSRPGSATWTYEQDTSPQRLNQIAVP